MHERSIVCQLLKQVEEIMSNHAANRVTAVRVSIGEFSGVEATLLSSAYDQMVESTPARGSELVIDSVPLEGTCDQCEHEFLVERFRFLCPRCRGRKVTILRGEDLMLESVLMEGVEP